MKGVESLSRHPNRPAARLRAVEVVLAGRVAIGDDMVVRGLLTTLLRKHRDVRWTTTGAAALGASPPQGERQVDHVVPLNIMVDRILGGSPAKEVLEACGQCYVTKFEHHGRDGLAGFRSRHKELRRQMQTGDLDRLMDLGWERYREAGLVWIPLEK